MIVNQPNDGGGSESVNMFELSEVLKAVKGRWIFGDMERQAIGVSTDSRTIRPGDLFIALKGDHFDGHTFLKEVVQKGAIGLVISDEKSTEGIGKIPMILVSDTTKALGELAQCHRLCFKGPVIAVTGSCGKTSTKEMIASALSVRGPVLKSEGTQNNHIGVPWTLLKLKDEYWSAVVEMGMNHLGEIEYLAQMAKPQIGVITNVAAAHLAEIGSVEQVARAKCELLKILGHSGVALLNGDDEILMRESQKYPCRKVTFGLSSSCDVHLTGEEFPANLSASFQKLNALAAVAVAELIGIPRQGTLQVLSNWVPPKGRLEVKKAGSFWIIDDTYNANPLSMRSALEFLRDFQTSGKRIAILSDMLELGPEAERWHYRLGQQAAVFGLDHLILLGEFSKYVQKEAEDKGMNPEAIHLAHSYQEILLQVTSIITAQDVILVKGSRRMKMETVVEGLQSYALSPAISIA